MAAPEGYKTLGKIGISYKGDYNSNTVYERLDAVLHNGSTYLAIKDAPDGAPRDDKINWIYLAKGFSSDSGDSEITFTEAEARENINTGESVKTVFGKVKKWLADLAAAAFMQVITSYADLMAGTALDNYLVGAAAVKEGLTEVNSKLEIEQRYYTETSPGINVNSAYIKSFGLRINKAGNIVLVNGYIVFNAPGLNINDVITGLPFPSTLQCDFVVADYGNGETGVMKLQNGSVLMVASSIQPNMEYNTNFAYVIV